MARLQVIKGTDQGKVIETDRLPITIGREADNKLALVDDMVSRHHAQISLVDGNYVIKDLISSNGTFVNEKLVAEAVLSPGDQIRVGRTVVVFEGPPEGVAAVSPPAAPGISAPAFQPLSTAATIIATAKPAAPSDMLESLRATDAEDMEKVRRNLRTVYEISSVLSTVTNPEEVLDRLLDMIFEVVKADHGFIMLVEEATGKLNPQAIRRRRDQEDNSYVISRTITGRVLESGEGVLTQNALLDARFRGGQSIIAGNVHSAMCAPLRCRERILGIIHVYNDSSSASFTREDLEMLVAIGNEAGVALEHARLLDAYVRAERFAAVGSAVAGLSHYIKNIINGMQAGSMVVQMAMESRDMEGLHKGWQIVRSNQNKIRDLVMDMLNYSKEREGHFEVVNLNDIVEDVLEMMTPKMEARGVRLKKELSPDIRESYLDPVGIHRALLNLVSNAIDAIKHREGEVKVSTALDQEMGLLRLSLQDNGCGIGAEALPHIFEAFYSSKGSAGTGLGLAVTEKIVKDHKGTIQVTSEEDQGSTFVIELPYATRRPPTSQRGLGQAGGRTGKGKP